MSERVRSILWSSLTLVLLTIIVVGVVTAPRSGDRAQALGQRIKCPVCQGESISDSPSETARAMMLRLSEMVAEGSSDEEVVAFFQSRYGDEILLDPPLSGSGLILWMLPVIALGLGIVLLTSTLRRDRHTARTTYSEASYES